MIAPLLFSYFFSFSALDTLSWRRTTWLFIKGRNLCLYTDLSAAGKENTEGKILFCVEASWQLVANKLQEEGHEAGRGKS